MRAWLSECIPGLSRCLSGPAVAVLCVLGSASGAFASIGTTPETARHIRLLRPAHDDLRIQWSAVVHEEGGEFLLSREGFNNGPRRIVARVAPGASARYKVSDAAVPGAWLYRLTYRSPAGHEQVLATIELNVDELEPGRASVAPVLRLGGPTITAEAIAAWARVFTRRVVVDNDDVPAAPRARPLTPPPRGVAA